MAKKKNINVEEESTVKQVKGSKSKKSSTKQIEEAQQIVETAVIDPIITIADVDEFESETVTETTLVADEKPMKITEDLVIDDNVIEKMVVPSEKQKETTKSDAAKVEPKKVKVAVKNKPKNMKINSVFGDFTYNWNGQSIEY